MFLQNKYSKLYFNIISNAKPNVNEYCENHHIIPTSLGGNNNPDNIVKLSARQHFICHYLLIKMLTPNSGAWFKMVRAFMMMNCSGSNQQRYMNSRLYASKKLQFSELHSKSQSGSGNSQFGTRWVTKDRVNLKVKQEELNYYIAIGYVKGRFKESNKNKYGYIKHKSTKPISKKYEFQGPPEPTKKQVKEKQLRIEREILKPFKDRYINGESLRSIKSDYGKSHVSLHKRLRFHFPEIEEITIHGTNARK